MSRPATNVATGVLRWCTLAILTLALGCTSWPPVDSKYGRRDIGNYGGSVNGTSVLSEMFEQSGFDVRTTRFLGRLVKRTDVVVWFPDDYAVPDDRVYAFFLNWLMDQSGRTLVYVGRGFDAEIAYWKELEFRADPDAAIEYRRREALARSLYDSQTSELPDTDKCPMFEIDRSIKPRRADAFRGPWSDGLVAERADIWMESRLDLPDDASGWQTNVLLRSGDDVIVAEMSRAHWNGSRVIVVNNGSWLLNLSLVNHEHRKLAGRLVRSCQGDSVVFVESGVGGPQVAEDGPRRHHGLEAFTIWPVNVVLLHLTVVGIVYCFAVFPIFGRAKQIPARDNSDFGRHITALGELLGRAGDENFAQRQIAHFHHLMGEVATRPTTGDGNPFAAMPPSEPVAQPPTSSEPMTSPHSTTAKNLGKLPESNPPPPPPTA